MDTRQSASSGIAIVGFSCRVPGARSVDEFWANVCAGVESVRRLSDEEMLAAGLGADDLLDPQHVPVGALMEEIDRFDAGFFGITAREAELMDPQHRVFLECAWSALEHAGYDAGRVDGAVGVFGGANFGSYLTRNLLPADVFEDKAAVLQAILANDKDYLATRVAYKLNLRGPAYTVQSGCSTSLVAVHLGSQSLLSYECDVALAGGVAIDVSRARGYWAHGGSVFSPDGHCRAFDAGAQGTVFGNGCAMVVLKRLEDAVNDGDTIYATILGSAVNNDGSIKVGFTAPSVGGQSAVIAEALAVAGVPAHSIGFVEAHGTGTPLGDPVEVEALSKAFGPRPAGYARCALGAVKSNVGHLDSAAGVVGLIKAALSLRHGVLPGTVNFSSPNPAIPFDETPFYVNAALTPWKTGTRSGWPRRAGVSSFGMGGTNAHVILEEAPPAAFDAPVRRGEVLVWSARSAEALDRASLALLGHLQAHPESSLADAAYTLQTGRATFAHRRILACDDVADATAALAAAAGGEGGRVRTSRHTGESHAVAFLFPGHGSQYRGMARELYESEPIFRDEIDACHEQVVASGGLDLRDMLLGGAGGAADGATADADMGQPALFAVEYALACLWRSWGVQPAAVMGHGVGDYAAACVAGVLSRADALRLVMTRATLLHQLPPGAMTAVALGPDMLELEGGLALAAINGPALSVVSGGEADVARLEGRLASRGVEYRRLSASRALQSSMVDAIMQPFIAAFAGIRLSPPAIPFISNVTGGWLEQEQATNPYYWAEHLRRTVRFADGLETLNASRSYRLVEVGPGRTLATIARQHTSAKAPVVTSLPAAGEPVTATRALLDAVGQLWQAGVAIDWPAVHGGRRRMRVPLPSYQFERARFWIEPPADTDEHPSVEASRKRPEPADWLYAPTWKQSLPVEASARLDPELTNWLVFADAGTAMTAALVSQLEAASSPERVTLVQQGTRFQRFADRRFAVNPASEDDMAAMLTALRETGFRPTVIVHAWSVTPHGPALTDIHAAQVVGFYSLLRLMRALDRVGSPEPVSLRILTALAQDVLGTEALAIGSAPLFGLARVIAQERSTIDCACLDLDGEALHAGNRLAAEVARIVAELHARRPEPFVALRGARRWVQGFDAVHLPRVPSAPESASPPVYAIVGGLGRIGLSLAAHLAKTQRAKLLLIGRSGLPAADTWIDWLASRDASDPVSRRIHAVRALQEAGAEVIVAVADTASSVALESAFARAESQFGRIDGVIAAAGIVDTTAFQSLGELTVEECERQFSPKMDGLMALDEVVARRRTRFCLLVSSLSSVLGGYGYGAYAAANAFMDGFALSRNRAGTTRWITVNWDAWRWTEVGSDVPGAALARLAMTPGEAAEVFDRIVAAPGVQQIVVSTSSLPARLALWVDQVGARAAAVVPHQGPGRPPATLSEEDDPRQTTARSEVPRDPAGAGVSAMPPSTLAIVVDAWREVLGIGHVEPHESFLDLGGNSLTAIQAINRIERALGVRIAIEEFIFQTAAQLARLCDQKMAERVAPVNQVEETDQPARGGLLRSLRSALSRR